MKALLKWLLALASVASVLAPLCLAADARPNVLFIIVDDLKPTLGCYGDELAVTPNFDRLADQGVTFTNANCQWPVCGASRASMTTGLMPEENGVTGFELIRETLPEAILLPQHFRENGYETVAIGKWHDHRTVGDGSAAEEDALSWSLPFNYGGGKIGSSQIEDREGRRWPLAAEAKEPNESKHADGVRGDLALEHIDNLSAQYHATGQPFFLAVGFARPHLPFLAPPAYWDLYDRADFEISPVQTRGENRVGAAYDNVHELENYYALNVDSEGYCAPFLWDGPREPHALSVENQRELIHGYYACTSFVDHQLGRLLDGLEANGVADNTIVVVIGDHGFHLGDHLKWGKHTPFEQAARLPFLLKAPGWHATGIQSDSPVTLLDLYPTLCEMAGLPLPEQPLPPALQAQHGAATLPLRGKSLTPVLADPSADLRFGAITTYRNGPYGYSYRTRTHRYIEWLDEDGQVSARELFDLINDPLETVNIAEDPSQELLVYRLARKMRQEAETPGCHRLRVSPGNALSAQLYTGDGDGDLIQDGLEIDLYDTDPFDKQSPQADSYLGWSGRQALSTIDPADDADGDAAPLIFEYLAGTNPGEFSPLQQQVVAGTDGLGISLLAARNTLPADVRVSLEGSADLGTGQGWVSQQYAYTVEPADGGLWRHIWNLQEPLDRVGSYFVRLKAELD